MKRDAKGRWYRQHAYKKAIVTVDNSAYLERLNALAAAPSEEVRNDE